MSREKTDGEWLQELCVAGFQTLQRSSVSKLLSIVAVKGICSDAFTGIKNVCHCKTVMTIENQVLKAINQRFLVNI